MYDIQLQRLQRHNAGGLTQDIKELISLLSQPYCFEEKIPKGMWKGNVKAVLQANKQNIRSSAEQYNKMINKIADDEKVQL